eukprot:COSAG01_NODE_2246_length_8080_cov_4.007017_2_plen_104_part_00
MLCITQVAHAATYWLDKNISVRSLEPFGIGQLGIHTAASSLSPSAAEPSGASKGSSSSANALGGGLRMPAANTAVGTTASELQGQLRIEACHARHLNNCHAAT